MALALPSGLSPSSMTAFTSCPLAFRFGSIEKLPEAPTVAASRGTLVHASLERLFNEAPADRTPDAARHHLRAAADDLADDPEFAGLGLDGPGWTAFVAQATRLVERTFLLEDPTSVQHVGLELRLEADVDGLHLRGIIDRLELDADGELVVTDYKTGRTPGERDENARLTGVQFYALLCEQNYGRRPAKVQLMYLAEPVAILAVPSEQRIRGLRRKLAAVWAAIERACQNEDFRPRPSKLCDYCGFRAWCPAWGGDPTEARQALLGGATTACADTGVAVGLPGVAGRLVTATPSAAPEVLSDAGPIPLATHPLGRVGHDLDVAVERLVAPMRGRHPVLDQIFYDASAAGDYSVLWHLAGAGRGLLGGRTAAARGVRLTASLGIESVLVNQVIKRWFDRARPTVEAVRPRALRHPLTSSFPSGHASSAVCAAVLLSDGSRVPALWWTLAAVVASSRVYVQIHHPTDVIAGALIGFLVGKAIVVLWPVPELRGR